MRARRRKKKKSINIKWSLIWIFLHSISLFVIGTLLQYINLKNNFFQILFLGFGISLLARVMRVFTANKKFAVNKWFVFFSKSFNRIN